MSQDIQATQKHRFIAVTTPEALSKDEVFLLRRFSGTEAMGRMFIFVLDILSERDHEVDFEKVLGQNITVRLDIPDPEKQHIPKAKKQRYFNGFVSSFNQTGVGKAGAKGFERYSSYRAIMVPWLWFLTQQANCRIFQGLTVPEIIRRVVEEQPPGREQSIHAFGAWLDDKNLKDYRKWEYCVQYRETDFNFISRLMEQEGIYYYFQHEEKEHRVVLCDAYAQHKPFDGYAEIPFNPGGGQSKMGRITSWTIEKKVLPTFFAHTDYNFKHPRTPFLKDHFDGVSVECPRVHAKSFYGIFDYPGEFSEFDEGMAYAGRRIEELQTPHDMRYGSGDSRGLAPGCVFKLKGHPRKDPKLYSTNSEIDKDSKKDGELLVTACSYQAICSAYESGYAGQEAAAADEFSCSLTTMRADRQFRSARITPKPTIQGTQTAVVVGEGSEEIYTDSFGRIKVQFHWDRDIKDHAYTRNSDGCSRWVRVAQIWAGKRWGAFFLPRVGQEVVVEFMEGDPDCPIVIGSVYNTDQMQHYQPVESKKMVSYIKSNSYPGGDGHNELRFDDTAGKEQLYMHAERNMDVRVKNNTMESVCHDRHLTVGGVDKDGNKIGDQKEEVYRDKHLTVHRNRFEHIGGDTQVTVGGIDGPGNSDVYIKKKRRVRIDGKDHYLAMDGRAEMVVGNRSAVIQGDDQVHVTGKQAVQADEEIHLKSNVKVIIEAGAQVSLKVGGNFVDIGPGGVTIVGTMVKINSGGAPGDGSGCHTENPEVAMGGGGGGGGGGKPEKPIPADNSESGQKSL